MNNPNPNQFPFESVLKPGDLISFGQACSEPTVLISELLKQGEQLHKRLGRLKLFVAGSYSGLIKPKHGAWFDFLSYGAIGDGAALARSGILNVYPTHYSRVDSLLAKELKADVVLLQLSLPNANGQHSMGIANDYQLAVARQARVVIAEVNSQVPFLPNSLLPQEIKIHHKIWTNAPIVEAPSVALDEVSLNVAKQVVALIPHRGTIQMGTGNLMAAVCHELRNHQDLGIHSGIFIDGMMDLVKQGVVTNAHKGTHVGLSLAGSLLGSQKLFEFAHQNPSIFLAETHLTHGAASLALQKRLCSINSAVEVDLTGQVNGEVANGKYVGAVGGQVDYVRAASESEGGISIIALPSSASGGKFSRIVSQLNGPVTTPRSDVDYVVTEWGYTRLKGLSLKQRATALINIAHPEHREDLLKSASELIGSTYD